MIIENMAEGADLVQVLSEEIAKSARISFCVSFLCYSGYALLINELKKALAQNAEIRILTSTYNYVTQPDAMRGLLNFPGIQVKLYDGLTAFHIKGYLFKYKSEPAQGSVIIGSANLSKSGLKAGFEWSLLVKQPELYLDVEQKFQALWDLPESRLLTEHIINDYEKRYKAHHLSRLQQEFGRIQDRQARSGVTQLTPNLAQEEALRQLALMRKCGISKATVVAAAGLGKTYLSAFDVKQYGAHSLLFLAHKTELLNQAEKTFASIIPQLRSAIISEGRNFAGDPFCFATVQSFTSRTGRMDRIPPDFFEYMVVDEFHHAAARTYQKILEHFQPRFLLGLTATPERPDGKDVLEICDNNIAYRVDMPEAINRQWLVPFHYFGVADDSEVVYDDIPWKNGHFIPEILESRLMQRRTDFVIEKINEYGYDGLKRRAVGFCAGREHSKYMAKEFIKRGLRAIFLTGEDPIETREIAYRHLEDPNDPLEFVFVPEILNEGVDIPSINLVLFLRPTESIIVFLQQLGRGLRLYPEKEVLTVIDFVANHSVAWNSLTALGDPSKRQVQRRIGDIIPPEGCQIILEDRTREILEKFQKRPSSLRQTNAETLQEMRKELGRPIKPVDFLAFPNGAPFWEISKSFGGWIYAKQSTGDAEYWELALNEDCKNMLLAFEKSWQVQRIGAYAKIWGLLNGASPVEAINSFLSAFPEWSCEREGFMPQNIEKKLEVKLSVWYANGDFTESAKHMLHNPVIGHILTEAIKDRILYHLKHHYRLCYEGVLRLPEDLLIGHSYSRPEIINHFQAQYDPARHNTGVLKLMEGRYLVLFVNLKKAGDRERRRHDYEDKPLSSSQFQWESQNRDAEDSLMGQLYMNHEKMGVGIHLFAQPTQGEPYVYVGRLKYLYHAGNNPMRIIWQLQTQLNDDVFRQLYPDYAEQKTSDFDWSKL